MKNAPGIITCEARMIWLRWTPCIRPSLKSVLGFIFEFDFSIDFCKLLEVVYEGSVAGVLREVPFIVEEARLKSLS